jgi:hypothetical protein
MKSKEGLENWLQQLLKIVPLSTTYPQNFVPVFIWTPYIHRLISNVNLYVIDQPLIRYSALIRKSNWSRMGQCMSYLLSSRESVIWFGKYCTVFL